MITIFEETPGLREASLVVRSRFVFLRSDEVFGAGWVAALWSECLQRRGRSPAAPGLASVGELRNLQVWLRRSVPPWVS